jgi:opacity protein-like surface antigen
MQKFIATLAALIVLALVIVQPAAAQVTYRQWDAYAGYAYLNTPSKDLSQNGYNLSFGHNVNKWLALGTDVSSLSGDEPQNSTGSQLAAKISPTLLAGIPPALIPALGKVEVRMPVHVHTLTFAAGTQFQLRKSKWVTPFFRPFLGAFHSHAFGDPTKTTITSLPPGLTAQQVQQILGAIPASVMKNAATQSDTTLGYGVGGGADFNISRPIGIRVATEYIRTKIFDEHQNNVRVVTGLIYRFGHDIEVK